MKPLFLIASFLVSMVCHASWETIKGNGIMKKEIRSAAAYSGIQLQGSMNVQVSYGTSKEISVEGDENLLPYIETIVDNGNLIIKTKNKVNLKSKNKLTIYASLTRLTNLVLSGSGNIKGSGAFTNKDKTEVKLSGSGNITMGVDEFNEMNVAVSGSGNVFLNGNKCNNISAVISGSGNIDCSDFKTNDVVAKISGSGNIKVNTSQSIDAVISGSGNIYYKGTATKLNLKSSGSGKIIKA